jgi:hypothetical protein
VGVLGGFLLASLIAIAPACFLVARLHVVTEARKVGLSTVAIAGFLLPALIGALALAATGFSPEVDIVLPIVLGIGSSATSVASMTLVLWIVDHTFWGKANIALFEITPQVASLSRRKPFSWFIPMFVPQDNSPNIRHDSDPSAGPSE